MSASATAQSGRSLYRSIYRQLARQHAETSKMHLEKDKKRTEALHKYAILKARTSGQPLSEFPPLEDLRLKRYKSDNFRSLFLTIKDNQAVKQPEQFAHSVAVFLESQRMYNYLLEYYNGSTIDEGRKLELSARRVGLELPDSLNDNEK